MQTDAIVKKIFAILSFGLFFICSQGLAGQKTHTVFFEGEENELHVYRIKGTLPGKTLLIIGGIQGDEPGGYLAADFYADFLLEKGNLIVVPRANFPSILKMERQINQDMNRKFHDDAIFNYETKVVGVLKKLICESDCFLNLHEGSGFYSHSWETEEKNPGKFGQSIIIDDSVLQAPDSGGHINLEKMAERVVEKINSHIEKKDHFFHVNNHRTNHPDSIHKEQLRSATYYAYNTCKVPAFGIESAKTLPLEQKVRQHIHAINGFMETLEIIPKNPSIDLKKPEMQYMIISVNNSIPVVVEEMQRLKINKGDTIKVHDIVANYERGLSVDVLGLGNRFNDMKNELVVNESTRIEVKKDFYKCGSVFIDIDPQGSPVSKKLTIKETGEVDVLKYKFRINNVPVSADNYTHVKVRMGDTLIIEDIVSGKVDPSNYIVNFKGFVGNPDNNSGEDRGYVIHISDKSLMKRYSDKNKGQSYHVVTTLDGKEVGKIFIDVQP
nr:hypothetical protein [Desulfobacula sp.]